jgi:subtilisin family serine protease
VLLQRIAIAGSIVVALAFPSAATADEPTGIVVQRAAGLDRGERLSVREDADVKLDETLPLPDTERVLPRAGAFDEALASLNANPDVVYAEPDLAVLPASTDPRFAQQWGLENTGQTIWTAGTVDADIDAPEAWLTTKGAGATVAVVDTGIELTHPDLAGQFTGNPGERGAGRETNGVDDDHNGYVDDWQGWDFVNRDNSIESESNLHGTHVAGTIAALADNGVGGAGVAPEARILPVKIFGAPGSQASSSTIAQAFDYAGALGVDVVNASLGGIGSSQFVTDVIESHPGTLYVVAAGNNGVDATTFFPCNSDAANLVCVGSTDNHDVRSDFSNFNASVVDLFAPGSYILSSTLNGGYTYANGTSMASPHVAGAAALLAADEPDATAAALKTALLTSVDVRGALTGLALTAGRLNAAAALTALVAVPAPSPTPAPSPSPSPAPPSPSPTPSPALPSPTPAPPVPDPVITPAPPAVDAPVLRSLKLVGTVSSRRPARVTFKLSAGAAVSFTVRCTGTRACASSPVARWLMTSDAGTRTFALTRRPDGRTLSPGRYTLTLTTAGGSRSVAFRVR